MTQRTRISQLFLRLFVTFLSFEAGAGLYETRVLIPLWSASPPETVRNWDSTLTSRDLAIEALHISVPPMVENLQSIVMGKVRAQTCNRLIKRLASA